MWILSEYLIILPDDTYTVSVVFIAVMTKVDKRMYSVLPFNSKRPLS